MTEYEGAPSPRVVESWLKFQNVLYIFLTLKFTIPLVYTGMKMKGACRLSCWGSPFLQFICRLKTVGFLSALSILNVLLYNWIYLRIPLLVDQRLLLLARLLILSNHRIKKVARDHINIGRELLLAASLFGNFRAILVCRRF